MVTGIDDHSWFVVCARIVARATARPLCQARSEALARHGVPEQILTDIQRQSLHRALRDRPRPVLFDRICPDNGIRHLLTAPYSPTTGKVERLHKTIRAEFFRGANGQFATIGELQAALEGWVAEYNTARSLPR